MENYEPRRGSGVGIPDIQVLVCGVLVPIEYKVGTMKLSCEAGTKLLHLDDVRPVQVRWHRLFEVSGGTAWFIAAFDDERGFAVYMFKPSYVCNQWKCGLNLKSGEYVGHGPKRNDMLVSNVTSMISKSLLD